MGHEYVIAAVLQDEPSKPARRLRLYACAANRTPIPVPNRLPDMTEPHQMSKPTEAGMARFTALLEELSGERDVAKASMFGMPGIKRRGGRPSAVSTETT